MNHCFTYETNNLGNTCGGATANPCPAMSDSSEDTEPNVAWRDVADATALDPEFPLGVDVDGVRIGLYLEGERVLALDDVCPHAYALLSQGFIEDGVVECPLHGARFEIATGKCLLDIGQRDLKCYPARVVGGRVAILFESP